MIGRNDPCLCGSGKKYKKCCLGKSEVPVEQLIDDELERILLGVYEQSRDYGEVAEFNGYRRQWYGKLGKLWDQKSIEASVTEHYLFTARQDVWKRHLSRLLNGSMRDAVRSVVSLWQEPIILLGKIVDEKDGLVEVKELFGEKTYTLEKGSSMQIGQEEIVFGIALPDHRKYDNGVYVITSLLFIPDRNQYFENEIIKLVQNNGGEANYNFYKEHMSDIYQIMLSREKASVEVASAEEVSIGKEVMAAVAEAAATVEAVAIEEVAVEAEVMNPDLTEVQQEVLVLVEEALNNDGATLEVREQLKSIGTRYFLKNKPNFRKPNVVAAAMYLVALNLKMLGEVTMTNAEVAKLFDVSAASIKKHAENFESFATEIIA